MHVALLTAEVAEFYAEYAETRQFTHLHNYPLCVYFARSAVNYPAGKILSKWRSYCGSKNI